MSEHPENHSAHDIFAFMKAFPSPFDGDGSIHGPWNARERERESRRQRASTVKRREGDDIEEGEGGDARRREKGLLI